jgi:predicted amidohydrolase YtcJ
LNLRILFDVIVCKQTVSDVKQGSWVLGGGWNNDLWGGELPMASWLDDFTADNPVRSPNLIEGYYFYEY